MSPTQIQEVVAALNTQEKEAEEVDLEAIEDFNLANQIETINVRRRDQPENP